MKIKSAEFNRSAPDLDACPQWNLPEFALIGRSNVGKSSLINFLTERRELAKVSDEPGKTQLINFFVINGNWCLVDLPGYGYARVAQGKRRDFNVAVADFLSERANLRGILVLIDSRLPPQAIDLEFLRWLESCRLSFALVFTKIDKQSAAQGQANIDLFKAAMREWRAEAPEILKSSSKAGTGRGEILAYIAKALEQPAAQRAE